MASFLMSNLPSQLPSGIDIKMALEGYWTACRDCDIDDVKFVINECVKGVPVEYDWAPQPAVVARLCRDRQARRTNAAKPKAEAKYSAFEPTASERRTALAEYARKVAAQMGEPQSPEEWVAARIKDGVIKPYTG